MTPLRWGHLPLSNKIPDPVSPPLNSLHSGFLVAVSQMCNDTASCILSSMQQLQRWSCAGSSVKDSSCQLGWAALLHFIVAKLKIGDAVWITCKTTTGDHWVTNPIRVLASSLCSGWSVAIHLFPFHFLFFIFATYPAFSIHLAFLCLNGASVHRECPPLAVLMSCTSN